MGNIDDSVDLNADKKFSVFDEAMFEQAVIQHLQTLGYEWLYGPNVKRTNESYRDILLPGVLEDCLRRINPKAHSAALAEALRKISDIEGVDLLTRNIQFMDYLQSGVEVSFFDGGEDRHRSYKNRGFRASGTKRIQCGQPVDLRRV